MKLRQECVIEFDKAVAVLDAQPDTSKEGPREKQIRGLAKKVKAQVGRRVSSLQSSGELGPRSKAADK